MSDWDAARYHHLSEPQLAWGRIVLGRLRPRPGERILDLGCGTGRLTSELASAPGIFVVALDASAAMLSRASAGRRPRTEFVRGDGGALPFRAESFDGVLSTATFHWIGDHQRLFSEIHAVLAPGGRLIAQCGGGPNLARLLERAHVLMDSGPYAPAFRGWSDPWTFAGVDETRARLADAGFESIDVSLHSEPTRMADAASFREFITCVCVRHHVDRLPAADRSGFVAILSEQAAADDPPFTLDYWRLNIEAVKGRRS